MPPALGSNISVLVLPSNTIQQLTMRLPSEPETAAVLNQQSQRLLPCCHRADFIWIIIQFYFVNSEKSPVRKRQWGVPQAALINYTIIQMHLGKQSFSFCFILKSQQSLVLESKCPVLAGTSAKCCVELIWIILRNSAMFCVSEMNYVLYCHSLLDWALYYDSYFSVACMLIALENVLMRKDYI